MKPLHSFRIPAFLGSLCALILLSPLASAQEVLPPDLPVIEVDDVPPPIEDAPAPVDPDARTNPLSLTDLNPPDAPPVERGEEDEESDTGIRDEDLFGGDEDPADRQETGETHLLRFEFSGSVQFMPQEKNNRGEDISGEPFLEVSYQFLFETPIELDTSKNTINIETDVGVDHWGSLAKNEFFDCQLDIDMPKMPVEVSAKIQREIPRDKDGQPLPDSEVKTSLILKIGMSGGIREDWFSLCTDFGGTSLNTQGEAEEYHAEILKIIDPPLSALVVEDYDPTTRTTIELSTPQKIINDLDIRNDILLTGQGQITLDPL